MSVKFAKQGQPIYGFDTLNTNQLPARNKTALCQRHWKDEVAM